MSIEDKLRSAAQALNELRIDPAGTQERLARLQERLAQDTPQTEDIHLTLQEVAEVLQISTMTVYQLIHSGDLPSLKDGRFRVFKVPEAAVYDYLADPTFEPVSVAEPEPVAAAEPPVRTSARASRSERPLGENKFLTVAEVAGVMQVPRMTVYRLVHGGHLPAIRVGRSFRVPESAVHEYLRGSVPSPTWRT